MPGALDGLRVLDLSTLFSAPQVSAMLGDLGADVVKLETPVGDPMRRMGASREGRSLMWAMVARNKRPITLDLDRPDGVALFHRLVERADVLVENQSTAILERWHATWDELSAVNPKLVMVSVSCFGSSGPNAGLAGAGTLAEAYAGLTHMTGAADGPPLLPALPIGDVLTAQGQLAEVLEIHEVESEVVLIEVLMVQEITSLYLVKISLDKLLMFM